MGNIDISSECSEIEKDIIDCLSNATFTDKNYINTYNIKFGQTNPFRVFTTAGGDYSKYERMINCFASHSTSIHEKGPTYFYKLRAIYELTGAGMKYVDEAKSFGFAKFLIWNTPCTDEIRVIPTARIVKNLIDNIENPKDWKAAAYGPIHLLQLDLKKLT